MVNFRLTDREKLPEEIAHCKQRLQQIRRAKQMIQERADERYQAEKEEYSQKMAERTRKEKETGKNIPGPDPKPPELGPRDKDQVNFTDSESRVMPTSENGFQQAYNGQAAVDMDSYLILISHLSQATNDKNQLAPMLTELDRLSKKLGKGNRLTAEAGYFSEDNVTDICKHNLEPYISTSRSEHHPSWKQRIAQPDPPLEDAGPLEHMKWKLQTNQSKLFYEKHKSTIEPVFGVLKQVLGFRQFLSEALKDRWSKPATLCL